MLYSYLPHYEMSWTLGHLRYVSYALAQSAKWKFLLHFSHSISLLSETQTEIECPILSDPLMATSETIEEAYTGRSMPQDLLVQIPSSKIVFCRLRQRSVEVCTSMCIQLHPWEQRVCWKGRDSWELGEDWVNVLLGGSRE